MFHSRYKNIKTTLNNKARDVIKADRFRWSQTFKAFKISKLETGAKDRNSEDNEKVEKTLR
jgi:hypothetical protein